MKKFLLIPALIFLFFAASCGARHESARTEEQIFPDQGESFSDTVGKPATEQGVDWEEITPQGVDEKRLIENVDTALLETVAAELQVLVREEAEEESEHPEIVVTQGWVRVFQSEHYKNVLALGKEAMKPLYLIILKSPNSGQYEYLCTYALYELSGFDFTGEDGALTWSTSKEFLEVFNAEILRIRNGEQ